MRIKRLTAENFGKFARFAVNLRSDFVVFSGQNEAGKTTLFELVGTLLFGASRGGEQSDLHALIRRGSERARLTGVFETKDGTLSLSRRIDREGTHLVQADAEGEQDLGDTAATLTKHMSRALFESIYSLDYKGMANLSDDVWKSIQHRLMGTGTTTYLKSVDEALKELNDQADELWRLDNFKGQRLRELTQEKKTKQLQLDEARGHQLTLLEKRQALSQVMEEISNCETRIDFERAFLTEAQKMNELRNNIDHIKELESQAPRIEQLQKWMPDIKGEYYRLKDRATSLESQLDMARRNLEDWTQHANVSKEPPAILQAEDEIYNLQPQESIDEQVNKIAVEKFNQAHSDFTALIQELLDDPDEEKAAAALDRIDNLFLNQRMRSLNDARTEHSKLSWELQALTQSKEKTTSMGLVSVLCFLLLAIGAGVIFIDPLTEAVPTFSLQAEWIHSLPVDNLYVGGAVGLLSLIIFIIGLATKSDGKRKKRITELQEDIEQAAIKISDTINDVRELLAGLAIPVSRLENTDRRLEYDIRRLQDALDKARLMANEMETYTPMETFTESRACQLAKEFLGESAGNDEEDIDNLRLALEHAKAEGLNTKPSDVMSRHQEDVDRIAHELYLAQEELQELCRVLGDEPEQEIQYLADLQSKVHQANAKKEELMSTIPNYRDVAARMSAMSQKGWPYSEDAIQSCHGRIDELDDLRSRLLSTSGALQNEIEHLKEMESPSKLQTQLLFIDREIESLGLRHDQLVLAAALLRAGNQRFSRLNQPKVLNRAGEYLSLMTGGRFDRMDVSNDRRHLVVRDMDGNMMHPKTNRLSQATREQIYLSLRLSLIDSFDEESEPLPIFLDEALITWDEDRLGEAITLLERLSKDHQIVLFTCHDWLVERIQSQVATMQLVEL